MAPKMDVFKIIPTSPHHLSAVHTFNVFYLSLFQKRSFFPWCGIIFHFNNYFYRSRFARQSIFRDYLHNEKHPYRSSTPTHKCERASESARARARVPLTLDRCSSREVTTSLDVCLTHKFDASQLKRSSFPRSWAVNEDERARIVARIVHGLGAAWIGPPLLTDQRPSGPSRQKMAVWGCILHDNCDNISPVFGAVRLSHFRARRLEIFIGLRSIFFADHRHTD